MTIESEFAQRLMQRSSGSPEESVSGEIAVIYQTTDGSFYRVDITQLREGLKREPSIGDALASREISLRNRQIKLTRDGSTRTISDEELTSEPVQFDDRILIYERQTGASPD